MPTNHTQPPTTPTEAARRFQIAHLLRGFKCHQIADQLGVTERTVQRWVDKGVNWQTAELVAVKVLGDCPERVFGRAWCEAIDEYIDGLSPRTRRRLGLDEPLGPARRLVAA